MNIQHGVIPESKRRQLRTRVNYVLYFLLGAVVTLLLSYVKLPQQSVSTHAPPSREVTVPIVAVRELDDQGVMGNLTVKLIPGNSKVLIDINPFSSPDLQYSADVAVKVAKEIAGNEAKNADFVLSYNLNANVVGGGSAGAATTLATIAALEGRKIRQGVAITGTINPDGTIGRVGGILEKARAVAMAGYHTFLIPKSQTRFTYYERVVEPISSGFWFQFNNVRYVPKTINLPKLLKEQWNLNVIGVSTIGEAEKYMLK